MGDPYNLLVAAKPKWRRYRGFSSLVDGGVVCWSIIPCWQLPFCKISDISATARAVVIETFTLPVAVSEWGKTSLLRLSTQSTDRTWRLGSAHYTTNTDTVLHIIAKHCCTAHNLNSVQLALVLEDYEPPALRVQGQGWEWEIEKTAENIRVGCEGGGADRAGGGCGRGPCPPPTTGASALWLEKWCILVDLKT